MIWSCCILPGVSRESDGHGNLIVEQWRLRIQRNDGQDDKVLPNIRSDAAHKSKTCFTYLHRHTGSIERTYSDLLVALHFAFPVKTPFVLAGATITITACGRLGSSPGGRDRGDSTFSYSYIAPILLAFRIYRYLAKQVYGYTAFWFVKFR